MAQNPYETPPGVSGSMVGEPPTSEEKNWAMLAHLSGLAGLLVGGVPGFLGPFIIWIIKKDGSRFVESEAREALNFQLTLLILYVVIVVIGILTCIGFALAIVPVILQVIFGIMATVTASKGIPYRYPFNIRLIS